MRQNRENIPANQENFLVENASRKALRELLNEFNTMAVDLKDKLGKNEVAIRENKT